MINDFFKLDDNIKVYGKISLSHNYRNMQFSQ